MSTEIKYKSLLGDQLTIQQAQLLDGSYQQELYVDGELKKIHFYVNNQIDYGTYYLSPGEDLQTILVEVQNVWRDGCFYINTHTFGDYTVKDWEVYEGLVKSSKGQTVYDNQGREIAEQTLDINTLEVTQTTKKYHLQNLSGYNNDGKIQSFGIIEFDYNDPSLPAGQISVNVNLPGYEHRSYNINDQQNMLLNPDIAAVFSWNDQTYYQNAYPFIPS